MFPSIFPDSVSKVYSDLQDLNRSGLAPGVMRSAVDKGAIYQLVKNVHSAALVAGYPVATSVANAVSYEVKQPVTAALNLCHGVAMGAIPAAGYGWVCVWGYCAAANVDGDSTDVVLGDSLKMVDSAFTLVHDQAVGTEASYARHIVALAANAGAAASKAVFVRCL
jgi:hypothetical protein